MSQAAPPEAASHHPSFDEKMEMVERSIEAHGSYLLNFLHSLTRNRQDAENLHSDLWVYVLHRFSPDRIGDIAALRRKARHLFIDHYRKLRRDPLAFVEDTPESGSGSGISEPFTEREQAEFRRRFFTEFPVCLPPEHEEALWLHAWCGHTFQEVAGIMGKPASTVGDWIAGARQAFADHLNSTRQQTS
ncbi:hypothetical protein HAHE_25050 [Haloferula helveola]|uniref:RNA polymerase sigma factor 70 region 4 type 2 domain-containing protein n=1 Tax=Haloferula helveola TaxID=490095 RepID=A0ABM7RGV0_9BACT|nr:hypothetical protein HAHE_25050 [Haloferula helveola]